MLMYNQFMQKDLQYFCSETDFNVQSIYAE